MVIFNELPSLAKIKKEDGDEFLNSFLTMILCDLSDFFNIGKGLTSIQVLQLVKMIKNDYFFLKPSELKYCFEKAKKGLYGKLYDRLDGMIIYEWLNLYNLERDNEIVDKNSNDKKEYEKQFNEIILPILKNISTELIENKPIEIKKEKNRFYDMHQRWINQFEKLRVGRFVKRYGKIMNMDEFFNYKIEQLAKVNGYLKKRNSDLL